MAAKLYSERKLARLFGDMIAQIPCDNCDGEGGYWCDGTTGAGSRCETPPQHWRTCSRCNGDRASAETAWQFIARVMCEQGCDVVAPGTVEDRLRDTVGALLAILEELGADPDAGYRWEILKRLRPLLACAVQH
jgi:hypothetical protein